MEIGSEVVQLNAMDADIGTNSDLTFEITAGNGGEVFTVDEAQGIISTTGGLDREVTQAYTLTYVQTLCS